MTDLRQAAQQALEALEDACGDRCNAEYNPCWQREVSETLKAALAEPGRAQKMRDAGYTRRPTLRELAEGAEPAKPAQEPFGYFRAEPFGWTDCAATDEGATALYLAPPQSKPMPAWLHYCPASDILTIHGRAYSGAAFAAEALATSLPQEQAR